jgi:prepilin-type processing-associated H-X9-DG protein/prepilin-type N-terminal cleavage/methylation domain-containing protein
MTRNSIGRITAIGLREFRGRCGAFTLTELLVVAAIVAMLAGLSLSVFAKVQTTRDRVESASRLRQWGVALSAYIADNNGDLPRRGQGVQPVAQFNCPTDWFNALPPYLGLPSYGQLATTGQRPKAGDHSLFIRPGAKDPGGVAFLGYAMNMNLSPWDLPAPARFPLIEHPAVTVFLAEAPGPWSSTYPSAQPYSCVASYNGQGNILFLDGHVSAYSGAYLGVGKGDPHRDDVSWLTGTASDSQASIY